MASPRLLALVKSLANPDGREVSVARVAHARQGPHGAAAPAAAPIFPLDPGQASPGLVIARQVLAFAAFESPGVAVHQPGIFFGQGLVSDAELDRGRVPHVMQDYVGGIQQLGDGLGRIGVFEIDGDAAFAAVARHGELARVPVPVVERVDLDDLGTEIREHLSAVGAGHGKAEVQNPNALERPARKRHMIFGGFAGLGQWRRLRKRFGFRSTGLGVAADWGLGSGDRPGVVAQLVDGAHGSNGAEFCILDLGDAAVGQKEGVGQPLLGGTDLLDTDPGLGSGLGPLVGGKFLHRVGHGFPVMVQDEELFRAQADSIGIFSRGQVGGCIQAFALASGEHETRARRPGVDEPAIGALKNPLGRPAIVHPGEESPGVQVFGDSERQHPGGQGALHE